MKKTLSIMFITIGIAIIYLVINNVMIKSVENVKVDFINVVCDKKEEGLDYGKLLRYDHSEDFEIRAVDNLNLEIKSVFHNSKEGYMNVVYSFEINEGSHGTGAYNINSKWYIKKVNNRWIVYDIDEAP